MIDGAFLRNRRQELGLSIRDVANLMGYASHFSYYRIERGQSHGSKLQIQLLADALGCTWDVFCKRKMHIIAAEDLTVPDLHFCC